MVTIFLVLALLILLPDAYIVFGVVAKWPWWGKGIILLPTIAYYFVLIKIFAFGDMRQEMLNMLFWLTLCVLFPLLLFSVISLIG